MYAVGQLHTRQLLVKKHNSSFGTWRVTENMLHSLQFQQLFNKTVVTQLPKYVSKSIVCTQLATNSISSQ